MWRLRVLLFKQKLCILCTGNHTHTHVYTVQFTVKHGHSLYPQLSTITCLFQTTNKQHTAPHGGHWHRRHLNRPLALSSSPSYPLTLLPSLFSHPPLCFPLFFLSFPLSPLPCSRCLSDFFFFFPCLAAAIINSLHAVMADWSDGPIPLSFLLDGGCYSK